MSSEYDTHFPLKNQFPNHEVGVRCCGVRQSHGKDVIEMEVSGVALWHDPTLMIRPADNRDAAFAQATWRVLQSIDSAIEELQSHKVRLTAELARLESADAAEEAA